MISFSISCFNSNHLRFEVCTLEQTLTFGRKEDITEAMASLEYLMSFIREACLIHMLESIMQACHYAVRKNEDEVDLCEEEVSTSMVS